jgi:hypothetical protein
MVPLQADSQLQELVFTVPHGNTAEAGRRTKKLVQMVPAAKETHPEVAGCAAASACQHSEVDFSQGLLLLSTGPS